MSRGVTWNSSKRCAARNEDGEQCGMPDNHSGHPHTLLMPSGVPWFGQRGLPLPSDVERALGALFGEEA